MPSHGRKHGDHCETFHCHRQRRPTPNISVCMGIDDVLQGFAEFSECIHSFFDHVFAVHCLPQLQSPVIQFPECHYSSPVRLIELHEWLDVRVESCSLHGVCSSYPGSVRVWVAALSSLVLVLPVSWRLDANGSRADCISYGVH